MSPTCYLSEVKVDVIGKVSKIAHFTHSRGLLLQSLRFSDPKCYPNPLRLLHNPKWIIRAPEKESLLTRAMLSSAPYCHGGIIAHVSV